MSGKQNESWFQKIKRMPSRFIDINLSHNTGMKVFSLVLAILFWFFVMDQVDPEMTRSFENIPVELINMQDLEQGNLKIKNQQDYFVTVDVKGRRNDVSKLNPASINLWADMRTVRSGINNVYINRSINSDSIVIKEVVPNEIVLTVERIVSVPKPVKVIYNDGFQKNYYEISRKVSPEEIRIVGPESIVETVTYLGAYVNVGTFTGDVAKEVSLAPYNEDGEVVSGVTLESSTAQLELEVGLKKEVPLEVAIEGEPAEGTRVVSVKLLPETVWISGAAELVGGIDKVVGEPVVLNGEEASTLIVNKNLTLPEGVSHDLENGVQVEVEIEPIVEKTFEFPIEALEIRNLAPAYAVSYSDETQTVTFTVKGLASVMETVTEETLKPFMNAADVDKEGTYRLIPQLETTVEIDGFKAVPEYVELEVVAASSGG